MKRICRDCRRPFEHESGKTPTGREIKRRVCQPCKDKKRKKWIDENGHLYGYQSLSAEEKAEKMAKQREYRKRGPVLNTEKVIAATEKLRRDLEERIGAKIPQELWDEAATPYTDLDRIAAEIAALATKIMR